MKASAWILPITRELAVCVGEFELIHILPDKPTLFEVPHAPAYCQHVIVWQERIIPIMNLALRLRLVKPMQTTDFVVAILAYQAQTIEYGALFLQAPPRRCDVADEWACDLPQNWQTWAKYINACYRVENKGEIIPILHIENLFAKP